MRDKDVLNGFFLYSLLLNASERHIHLLLPHKEHRQRNQLQYALAQRNILMKGIGQEQYLHACDLCFAIVRNSSAAGGFCK
jgi:hypothetical protein